MNRKLCSLALGCMLAVGASPWARTLAAPTNDTAGRISVSVTSRGVRLSLSLPNRAYPLYSLARVVVRAQNVSDRAVEFWPPDGLGMGVTFPQAEVVSAKHAVLYPPALHWAPTGTVPPPVPLSLEPGRAIQSSALVILRSGRLRGSISIVVGNAYPGYPLRTPEMQVRLTAPDRPRIRFRDYRVSPARTPSVVLTPRGAVGGELHYMEWLECIYPGELGLYPAGVFVWSTVSEGAAAVVRAGQGERITAECPVHPGNRGGSLVQWHLIAGWPGHSVAQFNYPAG